MKHFLGRSSNKDASRTHISLPCLLAGGPKALGLFNRDESVMPVTAYFRGVGAWHTASVRDLWEKSHLGVLQCSFAAQVPTHR
jgi:hypothetical protein